MEIKVDIDDARIIKDVLNGLSKKDIEDDIIRQIKGRVVEKVVNDALSRIRGKVYIEEGELTKYCIDELGKRVRNDLTLKKIWNSFLTSSKFEDAMGTWLYDIVDDYFGSGIEISARFGKGKAKKGRV